MKSFAMNCPNTFDQDCRSVVKQLKRVCNTKGESLGSILGECCINGGKDTAKAQEAVHSAFDIMVKEKGPRVAFLKLLSEETLNARAQSIAHSVGVV